MSKYVSYQPVERVLNHPNADRLSIVVVGRRQTVHPTEEAQLLRPGDLVVRFPVGICIDPERAKELGIDNYCKPAAYNGKRSRCRVVTTKIRKVYSSGFIVPGCEIPEDELDEHFGVQKYNRPKPPVKLAVVKEGADWVYRTGAHPYLLNKNTMGLLNHLCNGSHTVVIYGRLLYNKPIDSEIRAFLDVDNVLVDGEFLPGDVLRTLCELYHLPILREFI